MKFFIYLSPFLFLLLLAVRVIECNKNLLYIDNNINYKIIIIIKGLEAEGCMH